MGSEMCIRDRSYVLYSSYEAYLRLNFDLLKVWHALYALHVLYVLTEQWGTAGRGKLLEAVDDVEGDHVEEHAWK